MNRYTFLDKNPSWAKLGRFEPNTISYLKTHHLLINMCLLIPRIFSQILGAFIVSFRKLTTVLFLDLLSFLILISRLSLPLRRSKETRPVIAVFSEGTAASGFSPAANYRVHKLKREFENRNYHWLIIPAQPSKYHSVYFNNWRAFRIASLIDKTLAILLRLHRYWQIVWFCPAADVVIFQRELTSSFSLSLEFLARSLSRSIIFDFDDAIFTEQPWDDLSNPVAAEFRRLHKIKIDRLLSEVDGITASNEFLAEYARKLNNHVKIAPTPVDTQLFHPVSHRIKPNNSNGIISWIGTSGNLIYIEPLIDVILQAIKETAPSWKFVIVCNDVTKSLRNFYEEKGIIFKVWTFNEEVSYFQNADIGIMPLKDEPWSRGKMGYKLLQYMSCGLPVVASPVGYNSTIVKESYGFLPRTPDEWYSSLVALLSDPAKRQQMGDEGRNFVETHYGLKSFADPLESMILEMMEPSNVSI